MPRIWYLTDGSVHITNFPADIEADAAFYRDACAKVIASGIDPATGANVYAGATWEDVPAEKLVEKLPATRAKRNEWTKRPGGGVEVKTVSPTRPHLEPGENG